MDKLELAKKRAIRTAPYLAYAIATATYIITDKVPFPMACDKYWRVYVNPLFLEKLHVDEVAWDILHEVGGHLLRGHGNIVTDDHERFNIAGDLEIESWEWPGPAKWYPGCEHPDNYQLPVGETWRYYYEKLPKEVGRKRDCGSCAGGDQREWELGPDEPGAVNPNSTKIKLLRDKTAKEIARHSQGKVPAGLVVWADQQIESTKVRWDQWLRTKLSNMVSCGVVDLIGPSKEKFGTLSPRWRSYKKRIAVVADTSGSMNEHAGKVLGAVFDLAKRYGEAHVCWVDTEISWQKVSSSTKARPIGGGGTDLRPAILDARKQKFDAIVIVTDCETPWPEPCENSLVLALSGQPPTNWRSINVQ